MVILTDEQRRAAHTIHQSIALVAPAGSGKTAVLVERYLALLKTHTPHQILTCTFTNEAADQLRARVVGILKAENKPAPLVELVENSPLIGTLHSFCLQIVRQYGRFAGLKDFDSILTSFAFEVEFANAYSRWLTALPKEVLEAGLEYFGHRELKQIVRDGYHDREMLLLTLPEVDKDPTHPLAPIKKELRRFVIDLNVALLGRGLYSFDDLELQARRLLRDYPQVRGRIQREIRALLVDEFQDTSPNQWEILQYILGEEPGKLFIVGDPRQSIYGFRRAEPALFSQASNKISEKGGLALELTLNFRTAHGLLQEINRLSASDMKAFHEGDSGNFYAFRYACEEGAKRAEMQKAEMALILKRVQELLAEGIEPHDIALLFRVGDRVTEFSAELQKLGIASICHRSGSVFENYEVLDLYHFLKTLNEPNDSFHLSAFLLGSYVKASGKERWELRQGEPGTRRLGQVEETLVTALKKSGKHPWLMELLESEERNALKCLEILFANTQTFPVNHELFLILLQELQDLTVTEAAERMEIWKGAGLSYSSNPESSQSGISLMTVHAAKGLEFKHVLIADCLRSTPKNAGPLLLKKGIAPGVRYKVDGDTATSPTYTTIRDSRRQADDLESERILYVAMTRAKQSLSVFLPENVKEIPKGTWAEMIQKALAQVNH